MFSTSRLSAISKTWILYTGLILMIACGPREDYLGTYKAMVQDPPRAAESVIELRADGNGIWRVGDEEASFSWYVKGKELRVNTKDGGVVAGTIRNDTIHISLDGTAAITFKKIH
ncbi:MAG: hypothetical protein GX443_07680 [Deltaproteobacteria bacterium]|nr:hypothetical protein [Deltaproteobacteria bacterium]